RDVAYAVHTSDHCRRALRQLGLLAFYGLAVDDREQVCAELVDLCEQVRFARPRDAEDGHDCRHADRDAERGKGSAQPPRVEAERPEREQVAGTEQRTWGGVRRDGAHAISPTIRPSRSTIRRRAAAATSSLCVMTTIVVP